MKYLRQSTAAVVVAGPFLDKTDGLTGLATLGDQSANARLVKGGTGGVFAAASWTHDGGGHYLVGVGAADTDTAGRLRLSFSDPATFVPVWEDFTVLPQAVYDVWLGSGWPTAAEIAAAVGARKPVVRNQDAVTEPTNDDCSVSAWVEACAKEPLLTPTTWVKRLPDDSGAFRTFETTTDTAGNVTSRA